MSAKETYYFTGLCLSLDDHPENRESVKSRFASGEIIPDEFIRFCDSHLILPLIYLKLKNHHLLDNFPVELKTHLAGIYLRNKQRNIGILQQVDEINHTLGKKKIQPVYLKGTAHVLDKLYSDTGERLIGDIDLLVQDNDYLKAVELLKDAGYCVTNRIYSDVTRSTHYPPLFKEGAPVHLEVHRLPVNPPYSKWFTTESCFSQKKKISGKTNCYVQSDGHQLVHNFIHSQLNNLGYDFKVAQLRDLCDFYLLGKRVNTEEIVNQVPEKEKLSCYYALSDKVFKSGQGKSEERSKKVSTYLTKFDWYLDHPSVHHLHILREKINELLFYRFFPSLGELFTRNFWTALFRNLGDVGFYRMLIFRAEHFWQHYIRKH